MTGATCCSGIGAPETAMPWVNWKWAAEVERFPSSVLAARHPQTTNLGDITAPDFIARAQSFGHINILVAGTPCQAFSVAGHRRSLDDERGNLTLRFVEIVDAINPDAVLWENVPGVLSTADNAFGCFLAALVGADEAIVPIGGWTNAGMVSGPRRNAAWRVLDAQYFGLAQRRKRVFVVACPRNGADPREILFECEGVPRHSAPRREAGEGTAGTLAARTGAGGGLGTDFDLGGGLTVGAFDNTGQGWWNATDAAACIRKGDDSGGGGARESTLVATAETSHCLNAGGMGRIDYESETLVAVDFRNSKIDTDATMTIQAKESGGLSVNYLPHVAQRESVRRLTPTECERLQGFPEIQKSITINVWHSSDNQGNYALAGSRNHRSLKSVLSAGESVSPQSAKSAVPRLSIDHRGQDLPVVAHVLTPSGGEGPVQLKAQKSFLSASNADERSWFLPSTVIADIAPAIVRMLQILEAITPAGKAASHQRTSNFSAVEIGSWFVNVSGDGIGAPASDVPSGSETDSDCLRFITSEAGQSSQNFELTLQTLCLSVVRAIALFTPGSIPTDSSFAVKLTTSDGYTAITGAKDGPRYKALGNSMAVPCIAWIGRRILNGIREAV